jgi:hypothetical protein
MTKVLAVALGLTLLSAGATFSATVKDINTATLMALKTMNAKQPKTARVTRNIVQPTVEQISPVPLPAAGWMLLAGIGGMAALRRRARG